MTIITELNYRKALRQQAKLFFRSESHLRDQKESEEIMYNMPEGVSIFSHQEKQKVF